MSDSLANEFWSSCAQGRLSFQRCSGCGATQFYPRAHCVNCGGQALRWEVSAGRGVVYALTTVERAPTPDFQALQPYSIVLVDLAEGFRMMAHGKANAKIGAAVEVEFVEVTGRWLPRFVPVK